mmetsp:Transcript_116530/g.324770  ORF Transcript_116530/g.324770 Transcript_116530/m.324770 type:complete len:226 (+) Transcript_116530:681-1358(+)
MQLGRGRYHAAKLLPLLLLHKVAAKAHDLYQRIDLPASVRGVLINCHADPAAELLLEVCISNQQVVKQFLGHALNVFFGDERICDIQGTPPDGHIRVLQAIDDGGAVALHRLQIDHHHALKRGKGHIADVVVAAQEETSKDVDTKDSEPTLSLDGHDRQDALVEDRISCIFGALRVRCHLCKNVVHLVACFDVASSEYPQQPQDLCLQEGVSDTSNVILRSTCVT